MKFIYCISICILLFSCNRQTAIESKAETKQTKPLQFQSLPYKNKAFILSDSIWVYNSDFTRYTAVHGIARLLVTIDSISASKHFIGTGDTACDLYNLIKISSGKVNGWVYGKDVFEFTDKSKTANLNKDTAFALQSVNFGIYVLKNFGVGFENHDGLSFCGEYNPIALYNSKYERLEIIPVTDTGKTYSNSYVSLDNFDGWSEQITNVSYTENVLLIGIEREYQEGHAHFDILIQLSREGSSAIVTRAKEIVKHD